MTCHDCAQAKVQTWWGGYASGCVGCTARACARSLAAFDAVVKNNPSDLQAMLKVCFPELGYADARKMVWDWYLIDHPEPIA